MSLLSSIFGKAQAAASTIKNGAAPDLFGSKIAVPLVMHKAPASTKKRKGAKANDGPDDETEKSGVGTSSSDEPSSCTPQQQPTPEEDGDSQTEDISSANITKKTKVQSKSEEEEEKRRTIFVGNLPPDISRRSLAGIFKPCGNVASSRLRSMAVAGVKLPPEQAGNQNMMRKVCANTGKILTDTPKKSAQGYVVFETVESVDEALRMNNTTYQTHTIRVDRADPTVEPSRSVFVGNLPYGADEETLRDHFSGILNDGEDLNEREGGAISGVRIIRDKETQKCKGFGYVTLRDATLVANALQAHGTTYMKRELRVMICGKRFKGNRGDDSAGEKSARRSFDGKGAKGSSPTKNQSSKRKFDDGAPLINGGAMKRIKRRARSEKKTVISGTKSGLSKRAAAVQKVNKRVKKLQNRVVKGMGKKKH